MLNKILVAIIGVMLISLTAFLVAGISQKEQQIITTVEVVVSAEEAWKFMMNIDNRGKWLPEYDSYKLLTGSQGEVGSSYKVVYVRGENQKIMRETLTVVEPGSQITFDVSDDLMEGNVDIKFRAKDNTTSITETHTFVAKGILYRSINKIMKKAIVRGKQVTYEKLKEAIEQEY